ncbi:MAG: DUF4124 domain-containing protein [Burkholderiales bacterium]
MHRAVHTLAVAALLVPPWASAQVWKCADGHGRPVYQDAPCPEGRTLRDFAADPPPVSVVPLRPAPGTVTRATAAATPKDRKPAASRKGDAPPVDAAERRHLQPGMHEGEVLARLGPPDMKSGGGGRKLARWTYMPAAGDPQTLTTVVFEYGKVVEVERKVVR